MSRFGLALETELANVEGSGKKRKQRQTQLMNKWLDIPQRYKGPSIPHKG